MELNPHLSTAEITNENVDQVSNEVNDAVNAADDLDTVHVELAADLISNITANTEISEGVRIKIF